MEQPMTIVIGLAPNERGAAAVHLGSMLARSVHDDVVVATVVPTPWPPNPYRADAEYLAFQEQAVADALAAARAQIGPDLSDRKALVSAMTEIHWAIKTCKAYRFLLFIVASVYILPAVALLSEFLTLIKKV